MNTKEDIKRMLSSLVDEAYRIGKTDGIEERDAELCRMKGQVATLASDKERLQKMLEQSESECMVIEVEATLDEEEMHTSDGRYSYSVYRCSNCQGLTILGTTAFCPHCGARIAKSRGGKTYSGV